jgi:3',5'-cyclic AMP phosphodiesterase CpdA
MDRRGFLAWTAAAIGSAGGEDAVGDRPAMAADLDTSVQAVESSHLTLTPKSSDRWELVFKPNRALRILQVTDTHFSSSNERDRRSARTLDALIRQTNPDLIVHTGDFVNNDSDDPVTWGGVEFFNQLNRPWALCFGNHDYPVSQSPGSLSLDDFRKSLKNCAMGFAEIESQRRYCYRHDLIGRGDQPAASLFYFQVGYAQGDRKISDPQLSWFNAQLQADQDSGCDSPILVFVHIPLIEYDRLVTIGKVAGGFKNEKVCFDSDTGESFKAFAASGRVQGVFCGHDHVNNYFGTWDGIGLHYGRVSGWGGYGDWARGGRLITVHPVTGRFTHREVVM